MVHVSTLGGQDPALCKLHEAKVSARRDRFYPDVRFFIKKERSIDSKERSNKRKVHINSTNMEKGMKFYGKRINY